MSFKTNLPQANLNNSEVINQDAAAFPGEVGGFGETFSGRTGDTEGGISLAAESQSGIAGAVLDEDGGVTLAGHLA